MRAHPLTAMAMAVAVAAGAARAQDWTTAGYDAQRSSWVRADAGGKISATALQKPGFQLLWKLTVADALTAPVLLDLVIGYRGFRALGFVGAPSDRVVAIDTDLGRVEWERRLSPSAAAGGLPACAREMTPQLARPTNAALAALIGGGRHATQPAHGAVGEPGEGAVTLAPPLARRPEAPRPPPAPPQPSRPRPTARPFPVLYVLPGDGLLRTLNVMNGADVEPPVPFLRPHAVARGLIIVDDIAYVATSRGCGAAPDAIWALDLGTHQVTSWRAPAPGRVAGAVGPAIGPDGTIYVTTGDGRLVALESRTLKPRGTYRSGGPAFSSSPVIFDQGGRLLIAAASRDGRIRLLASGRATLVKTPVFSHTPAGELATWADTDGTRWLAATADAGGLVAGKVVQQDTVPILERGWVSRDLPGPLGCVVVNDVVFTVSRGARPLSPMVLHALDGASGHELWNSGTAIAPGQHAALSAGGSQVYVAAGDGTLYAFGFPVEH